MNRKISSFLLLPILLLSITGHASVQCPQATTDAIADSSTPSINLYARLVLTDCEIHYIREAPGYSPREVPLPNEWNRGLPPEIVIHPEDVEDPSGKLDPGTGKIIRWKLSTSTTPAYLYQERIGKITRMVQVAEVGLIENSDYSNQQMWYRTSITTTKDDGTAMTTVTAFRPMIQAGFNLTERFKDVFPGMNGMWAASTNIVKLNTGAILVPISYWPLAQDPMTLQTKIPRSAAPRFIGGSTSVNAVLTGVWNADSTDVSWSLGGDVRLPENLSTRGATEPAVAELKNGDLVMISRGSNEGSNPAIPGRRWVSRSQNRGQTWSTPIALCYGDGTCPFSPSSQSNLVRAPNGLLYWIGNITDTNPIGNSPRYPIKIGEIDETSLVIIRGSVIQIDDFNSKKDSQFVQLAGASTYVDNSTATLVIYLQRVDAIDQMCGPTPMYPGFYPINWYKIGFHYGR